MTPIEKILPLLKGVKGGSDKQWQACCPAHEDGTQSLGVAVGSDGRVLVKCYAGCDFASVARSLNLKPNDFFPDGRARSEDGITVRRMAFLKRLPFDFLRDVVGLRDAGSVNEFIVGIPYKDEKGELLFERTRLSARAKDGTRQPKGVRLKPYGLWRLKGDGNRLIIVEGESDCWALWYHGYAAIGVPGADAVQCLNEGMVKGFKEVYVWREPDKGGDTFYAKVARKLPGVKVISRDGVKDPSDLHCRFADGFKEEFEKCIASAVAPDLSKHPGGNVILPDGMPAFNSSQPTFPMSDLGNAQRFAWQHGQDVKFVWHGDIGGEWRVWNGRRWENNVAKVEKMAKETVRSIYLEAKNQADSMLQTAMCQHALKSENWNRFAAMMRKARSEDEIVSDPWKWDRDTMTLNVSNGTIDLTTGKFTEHRRELFGTQIAPVNFDPKAKCPVWLEFLNRVFSPEPENPDAMGDGDFTDFMQRLLGYCITGEIRNHVLPIFWGDGANGKSTLINVMCDLLGNGYSAHAPQGMLLKRQSEQHATELTVLQSARFVVASETKMSGRLAEDLVKKLTSGEPITARKMRMDYYQFQPTHKMVICTNHQPRVGGTDGGIWRRIRLVPFLARFWDPDTQFGPDHLRQDKLLDKKLKKEMSGILNWLVAGAVKWNASGLPIPKIVRDQTEAYKNEEDTFGQFLSQTCRKSNSAPNITLKAFSDIYRQWCEAERVYPMNNRGIAAELRNRGYVVREGNARAVTCYGIEILNNSNQERSISDFDD